MGNGSSRREVNALSRAQRRAVLGGEVNAAAIARRIKEGRSTKIVVLAGAGISCSAGIPDFRSPRTGLYHNLAKYGLPTPESIFEIGFFRDNPRPFFHLARELFPGKFDPTLTHYLLRLLHEKGALHRVITQNIDCLERIAGVPASKLVEAHGTFASSTCTRCQRRYDLAWLKEKIITGPAQEEQRRQEAATAATTAAAEDGGHSVAAALEPSERTPERGSGRRRDPRSEKGSAGRGRDHRSTPGSAGKSGRLAGGDRRGAAPEASGDALGAVVVPRCDSCGGVVKPDITFFGEDLPARFHRLLPVDVAACDLLIVMGTSLQVYPVGGIPELVGPTVPRLLINRDAVGEDLDYDSAGEEGEGEHDAEYESGEGAGGKAAVGGAVGETAQLPAAAAGAAAPAATAGSTPPPSQPATVDELDDAVFARSPGSVDSSLDASVPEPPSASSAAVGAGTEFEEEDEEADANPLACRALRRRSRGFIYGRRGNYRDVYLPGDADAGALTLAGLLGWTEELLALQARELARLQRERAGDAAGVAGGASTPGAGAAGSGGGGVAAAGSALANTGDEEGEEEADAMASRSLPTGPAAFGAAFGDAAPAAASAAPPPAPLSGAAAAAGAACAPVVSPVRTSDGYSAAVDAAGLGILEQALADLDLEGGDGSGRASAAAGAAAAAAGAGAGAGAGKLKRDEGSGGGLGLTAAGSSAHHTSTGGSSARAAAFARAAEVVRAMGYADAEAPDGGAGAVERAAGAAAEGGASAQPEAGAGAGAAVRDAPV